MSEAGAPWSLDDIPFASIDRDRVRTDESLFLLLASASFVEITSDLYTENLLRFFHDDREITAWLEAGWRNEELQHGAALRRYVAAVWPEFHWERAYREFFAEYSRLCRVEDLEATRTLEMAARCLVETGTATLYGMVHRWSREPVLAQLTACICRDEVRHYKHFYRYFLAYRSQEEPGSLHVLQTLCKRAARIGEEDAHCAIKHVYQERHPGRTFRERDYRRFRKHWVALARLYYPYSMAVKMFLKPLGLNRWVQRAAVSLLLATHGDHRGELSDEASR